MCFLIILYCLCLFLYFVYFLCKTGIKLVEAYCRVTEGLLGFRGALSWREAGVGMPGVDEAKQKKIDKILSK